MTAAQWTWFDVAGRSMWPLCPPMQVAIGPPCAQPRVGDCVAFVGAQGRIVVHRVVAIEADRVWTRGDTNLQADPPWPRHAAIGKVVAVRCRGIMLTLPQEGRRDDALRAIGRGWSRVAPRLRQGGQAVFSTLLGRSKASEC
jgi:hypothetical protein